MSFDNNEGIYDEPDRTIFDDITVEDVERMTFNEVMVEVRKFLHEDIPRYSLFNFEEIDSDFSFESQYYEGIVNYCLACASGLAICLLVITAFLMIIRIRGDATERPIIMGTTCYQGFLIASASIVLFFAFWALLGFLSIQYTWRQINSKYTDAGIQELEEFHTTLKDVIDTVFKVLTIFRETVSQLSLLDFLKNQASSIAKSIVSAGQKAFDQIKESMKNNVVLLLDKEKEAKETADKLLELVTDAIFLLKAIKIAEIVCLCLGLVFMLWTIAISVMMIHGALKRCSTYMRHLCRLACCTLVMWWIIAVIAVPAALALADYCYDPATAGADVTNHYLPLLSKPLVYYYLACDGENPIGPYLQILAKIFNIMLAPLFEIFTRLKSIGLAQDEEVLGKLHYGRDFVNQALLHGCSHSKYLFDKGTAEACDYFFLGVVMIAAIAPCIGFTLTVYVMICLRSRDIIEPPEKKKKPHICSCWPELGKKKKRKKDEKPEVIQQICEPDCVGAEILDYETCKSGICPHSGDPVLMAKMRLDKIKKEKKEREENPCTLSNVCAIGEDGRAAMPFPRERQADRVVVKKRVCPTPGLCKKILEAEQEDLPEKGKKGKKANKATDSPGNDKKPKKAKKRNMAKWGFIDQMQTRCDCGAPSQNMSHLLSCPLCPSTCTMEDLYAASINAVTVAQLWENNIGKGQPSSWHKNLNVKYGVKFNPANVFGSSGK